VRAQLNGVPVIYQIINTHPAPLPTNQFPFQLLQLRLMSITINLHDDDVAKRTLAVKCIMPSSHLLSIPHRIHFNPANQNNASISSSILHSNFFSRFHSSTCNSSCSVALNCNNIFYFILLILQ
jgi:hypothetical protein